MEATAMDKRRAKMAKRKALLSQALGASSSHQLSRLLGNQRPSTSSLLPNTLLTGEAEVGGEESGGGGETAAASAQGSFLKGTQSANPHNDYSQNFVDTGQRPQNFIRDPAVQERFTEYPRLKELMELKDALVSETATPPMYLSADLRSFPLRDLGSRFDVILIEPPLSSGPVGVGRETAWDWSAIAGLDIPSVAENRCFVWLWCGSEPGGTGEGRAALRRWGFRRCEDICWVKTNRGALANAPRPHLDPGALLHRTKEHCLMGIKGTVRRSVDGDFIHANVDIDLLIAEEPDTGAGEDPRKKPEEIFALIERFCLGRRRLHLFGREDTLRPGWVTVGKELSSSNYDAEAYLNFFRTPPFTSTGCSARIEALRPKSPERGSGGGKEGGRGRGGGVSRGGGASRGGVSGVVKRGLGGTKIRGTGLQRKGRGGIHHPTQTHLKAPVMRGRPMRRRMDGVGFRGRTVGGRGLGTRTSLAAASRVRNHYRAIRESGRGWRTEGEPRVEALSRIQPPSLGPMAARRMRRPPGRLNLPPQRTHAPQQRNQFRQ